MRWRCGGGTNRDQRGLRRFEQEAHAASALNHPNILTIYEFGHADGVYFIVSEFVEGVTLRQKMSGGRLDLNTVIEIAIQIAGALAAAHAAESFIAISNQKTSSFDQTGSSKSSTSESRSLAPGIPGK